MKYSLSQYVHDGFRLRQIEAEQHALKGYMSNPEWKVARLMEIQAQWLAITERMAKFEKHPYNR